MIKGNYDKLRQIADRNQCAQHKKPLVVAWNGMEGCWTLRCGEGHYPDAVSRILSFSQEVKQGQHEEAHQAFQISRREEMKEKEKSPESTAVTLGGVPAADLATGELLSLEQVKALVAYARRYDLDPVRGHVVVMYGKPYIGLDGYLYHANRSRIPYKLSSRPLDEGERKAYQAPEGSHFWTAEVILEGELRSFTGQGVVTQEEITEESKKKPGQLRSPVVAKHPWQLAQKRAEWQALRRAFPIGEIEEKEE
ncbi:hypothetical protein ES708_05172 [subsurface metagenome]